MIIRRSPVFALALGAAMMPQPATAQKIPVMAGLAWSVEESQGCVLRTPVIGGEFVAAVQLNVSAYDDEVSQLQLVLVDPPTKRAVSKVGVKIGQGAPRAARAAPSIFQSKQLWNVYLEKDEAEAIVAGKPVLLGLPNEVIQLLTRAVGGKLPEAGACERKRLAASIDNPPPLDQIDIGPKPRSTLVSLFDASDYPAEALRSNEEGRVVATVHVDARGRVKECAISESSGSRALDAATCSVIRSRAKFEPARDEQGRKIASLYSFGVSWWTP